MSEVDGVREYEKRAGEIFEVLIRVGLILLVLGWGFLIVSPFLHPIVWGVILAVALYPAFQRVSDLLGGKPRLAGAIFILGAFALVIVPAGSLAVGSVEGVEALAESWQAGELQVPPPPETVRELPLVGERLYGTWLEASTNLEGAVHRFAPQLGVVGGWLLALVASTGSVFVLLTFSLVIAGALMIQGESAAHFAKSLSVRLAGSEPGVELVQLMTMTIRGVAMGVVGTAAIQAAAAALGFVVMGVPLAGLWAVLVLVLAVIQLPALLVLGPIAIWSFTSYETAPAAIFSVWCLLVGASDNVIKPILMGRGQDVPMLVLLVGAIGGMILSGVMGLFVGAVVLAVIYRLFGVWLQETSEEATQATG